MYTPEDLDSRIREFVIAWADRMLARYESLHLAYIAERDSHITPDPNISGATRGRWDSYQRAAWFKSHGVSMSDRDYVIHFNRERLAAMLFDDAGIRAERLKAKIRETAGDIVDVLDLSYNGNGGFDGLIRGTKGTVSVETILAGGYNIQRLHYRTLVKPSR